jgi:hypothetical protein
VSDFVISAKATGKAAGMPDIRVAVYPGAIAVHPTEDVEKNIRESVFPQIIKLLTEPIAKIATPASKAVSKEHAIVFEGSFEEVNDFFYSKQWTDGLPIVPPTAEKVAEFLKYTDRAADEALGVLHPSLNKATVNSVAINGVMAGCLPEYMPVLVAIIEAIAEPRFHLEDAGSSAGWAPLIVLNGPVINRLGFNASTGVLRVGNQANTSVGRFLRLYMRNIAGFIPGVGDMGTFGRPNLPVLAENESNSPWEPLSVTRGFEPGDSVVTLTSVGFMSFHVTVVAQTPEAILQNIATKVKQMLLAGDGSVITKGPEMSPQLVMSPVIANTLAAAGYSKQDVQEYIYEHSKVPATEFDLWLGLQGIVNANECVSKGLLPAHFGESDDPQRMLPLYHTPAELQIIVAGTAERNRFFLSQNIARQGLATSKKVNMAALA